MNWGAHKADVRIAAKNSVTMRAALRASINPQSIYEAYQETQPFVTDNNAQDRARARAWAMLHVKINPEPIEAALIKIYADGFLLGLDASEEAFNRAEKGFNKAALTKADEYIDWANWKPGNRAASLLFRPTGAFKQILDNAGIVSKTIAKAGYDRIGTALSDSIAAGFSPGRAAKVIAAKIGDPARALTIAITEQNRAVSMATIQNYQRFGLEKMEWSGANPCDLCAPNEGQVVTVGAAFKTGNTQPPVHPNCRCALLPYLDESFYAEPTGGMNLAPIPTTAPERAVRNLYDGTTSAEKLRGTPRTVREMEKVFDDLNLTPAEREAFINYQESDFFPINSALRKGEIPAKFADEIQAMDNVFGRAPKVGGAPAEYYRTMDEDVLAGLKKGDAFIEKGYMSTSISKQEALMFGEDAMYTGKIRIIDTADAPKVWLDSITEAAGRSQKEVLFGRNTPMTYVGKDKDGFHVLVTNRYIDDVRPVEGAAGAAVPTKNRYLTGKDLKALGKEQAIDIGELSFDDSRALHSYKGADYMRINGYLRGDPKWQKFGIDEIENARVKAIFDDRIDRIQSTIEATRPIREEFITFRGITGDFADEIWESAPGSVFQDRGFASSTTSKLKAREFGGKTQLHIINPVGSKGLAIEEVIDVERSLQEYEWLLPKGTKFEIVSKAEVEQGDRFMRIIKVRVVK